MPSTTCPSCNHKVSFKSEFLGRKAACPQCQGVVRLADDFEFEIKVQNEKMPLKSQPKIGWYYQKNGVLAVTNNGPFDRREIEALITSGEIANDTVVWHQIDTRNTPASASSVRWIAQSIEAKEKAATEKREVELRETRKQRDQVIASRRERSKKAIEQIDVAIGAAGSFGVAAICYLVTKLWFWTLVVASLCFANSIFAYVAIPMSCWAIASNFTLKKTVFMAMTGVTSISFMVVFGMFDYIRTENFTDLGNLQMREYSARHRWTGMRFQRLTVSSAEDGSCMEEGWFTPSEKPHGKLTRIDFDRVVPARSGKSEIWYWYGEQVSEGDFVLRSRK